MAYSSGEEGNGDGDGDDEGGNEDGGDEMMDSQIMNEHEDDIDSQDNNK